MDAVIVVAVVLALIVIADRFGAERTTVETSAEYRQALTGAIRERPATPAPTIEAEPIPAPAGPGAGPAALPPAPSETI